MFRIGPRDTGSIGAASRTLLTLGIAVQAVQEGLQACLLMSHTTVPKEPGAHAQAAVPEATVPLGQATAVV